MEIKTCDEYVLNELECAKKELDIVKHENAELREEIKSLKEKPSENNVEELPQTKTYTISEQPNYFYYISAESAYNYNDILNEYNKTPEFLNEALDDEEKFKEFMEMTRPDWHYNKVGRLEQKVYDKIIKNFYGKVAVINTSYNDNFDFNQIDNETYFLDSELASETLKQRVIRNIKEYFKYKYNEKFKPKEADTSNEQSKN